MAMDEARRRLVALLLIEQHLIDQGIPGGSRLRQEAGNMAQKINRRHGTKAQDAVTIDELMKFYQTFVPAVLGSAFSVDYVSLTMGNQPPTAENRHDASRDV